MARSKNPTDPTEEIKRALRWLSICRLESLCGDIQIKLEDDDPLPVVRSHWMALIVGAGSHMAITFRVQFGSKDFPANGVDLQESEIIDFGKELCNLTMGGLKLLLSKSHIQIGTSLPIATRGFDSIFFPRSSSMPLKTDSWILKHSSGAHFCNSTLEIFHPFEFAFDKSQLEQIDGTVELL